PRDKRNMLADSGDPSRLGADGGHWLGGLMAMLPSLMPMLCPNVNSYKRLDPAIFPPGTGSWGFDVRTAPFRAPGRGDSLHIETRIPGADANFYLALAAIAAAGMHGLDHELEPIGDAAVDASTVPGPKLPVSLREALERFRSCDEAEAIFGADVVG